MQQGKHVCSRQNEEEEGDGGKTERENGFGGSTQRQRRRQGLTMVVLTKEKGKLDRAGLSDNEKKEE